MSLHVILRTCSHSHVHFKERFIPVPKEELIIGCLKSLVTSLHQLRDAQITLSVVDDHSSDSCIESIKHILAQCRFETEFLPLQETGNNASMKFCYQLGRDSRAELLYLVEDDYLHTLGCLPEMLEAYGYFTDKVKNRGAGGEVALMPVDNMFHYHDNTMFSSPLVLGPRRHWRVNYYANWTILMPRASLLEHWSVWWKFSDYQLAKPETHEDATIAHIFRTNLHLFTPVPTMALHVASDKYISPFCDWQKMWADVEPNWQKFLSQESLR